MSLPSSRARVRIALRHSLALSLAVLALTSLLGCGRERRLKDCAATCEEAERECTHRRERGCVERSHVCAEECRKL
jgi:hypothetical protein